MNSSVSRRSVLKASGLLVVAFSLVPRFTIANRSGAAKPVTPEEVDSYLAIAPDGRITVYSGKVDLGTGLRTALTQIVAEEPDLPLGKVILIQGYTCPPPGQGPSVGSLSIQSGGAPPRQAAAT